MPKRVVIPNEVRDLTNGGGSRNQIRVSKTSAARSFPIRLRADALHSGLRLFLQGSGACPELVEGLGMTILRGQLARVGQRVDSIDIFVAPNRFDPWETQRQSARVSRARLNRIERDLQDDVRLHLPISTVIDDRVLFEMLGQLGDLSIG